MFRTLLSAGYGGLFRIGNRSSITRTIISAALRNDMLPFFHVAISLRGEGPVRTDSVIEAAPAVGVRIVPLAYFLASATQRRGDAVSRTAPA